MKNIIFLLLFAAPTLFAQDRQTKSLLDFKNEIRTMNTVENENYFSMPEKERKKAGLAVLYSILLPGMGELYAGDYSSGKYLTIADGVFWGFFTGFTVYGNRQEDNYKAFAKAFGGVDPDGKTEKYFASIGEYLNINDYNRAQELNREFEKTFDVSTHYWDWGSTSTRKEYRETWLSSEQAKNNVRFAVGALIVNRVISAINAVRMVNKHNKNLEDEMSWNISIGTVKQPTLPSGFSINFYQSL